MGSRYPEEVIDYVIQAYPTTRTSEMAKVLGISENKIHQLANSRGIKKTKEYIREVHGKVVAIAGINNRFYKGQEPWNKGVKGIQIGGKETQFKKGHKPANHKPVASERIDEDGYTYIKIAEHTRWVLKHRYIYEQHHGKLEPHMIVTFRDKNISNFEIDNLEAITKVENMERNRITKYPKPIQQTIKTLNKLWQEIKSKI